ncbi:amidase (plasmid) [Rhizobium sp. TH2]|uniref:amidase n=1 Tax=Rhizobium sp. TH2 TaxID=2775403 RepID=UPI002157AC7F|nr:amidase [Rhizobium sp. TH2]UVC12212.1 amidase [Rhizobium sp. TH2]
MTIAHDSMSSQIAALADGSRTASSLAEAALGRAKAFSDLNAFVAVDEPIVMRQARAADQRRRLGRRLSPIDGIPIAVKDNYLTIDYPTTACSNALPFEPSGEDATVVANLRRAGAVVLGKTNMHEWAYGATNSTSSFGATRNPHDRNRITGGSSGGSGAAVAAGIVSAALGSDTGGSVRIPSAACGIYGFKPSYGRASRHGVLPLSWSLDAPGPMTASLEDISLILPYFFGQDARDPATDGAKPFQEARSSGRPRLIHLVGPGLERSNEVDGTLRAALDASDASVRESTLDHMDSYFAAWEAILHCEASAYHVQRSNADMSAYSTVTQAHLVAGGMLSGLDLIKAQRIRSHLVETLTRGLGDWDALVLPTLPIVAPREDEEWQEFSGRRVTTQDSMTWFCWIGNLAGFPCISIPMPREPGLMPVGMMLMGRPGEDEALLAVAEWIDKKLKRNV